MYNMLFYCIISMIVFILQPPVCPDAIHIPKASLVYNVIWRKKCHQIRIYIDFNHFASTWLWAMIQNGCYSVLLYPVYDGHFCYNVHRSANDLKPWYVCQLYLNTFDELYERNILTIHGWIYRLHFKKLYDFVVFWQICFWLHFYSWFYFQNIWVHCAMFSSCWN